MGNHTINISQEFTQKRKQVKRWISEYIEGFIKKNSIDYAEKLKMLNNAVEFAESEEALNMVNHFFKIRSELQLNHIDKNNFDKTYKKLNEKIVYQLDKMINKIVFIDFMSERGLNRLCVFNTDVELYKKQINNGGIA